MKNEVVVFGTGSLGEVAHFYLTEDSDYDVVAFTAHRSYITGDKFLGLNLVPFEEVEKIYPPDRFRMFIAVSYAGVNRVRAKIYQEAKDKGYQLISYVSSKTTRWGDTRIGDNCFILEDITIQPFVSIGNDVTIWSGNHIGHHAAIGDHCFITSHVVISGHVKIGPYCFIGVNATIRDGIEVAGNCVIGAGSLIMNSTREGEVYVARPTGKAPIDSTRVKM